ncbi:MAG: transposase [Bdellovibrionota bacterium]
MRKYKTYDIEFKKGLVKIVEQGKTISEVSKEYNIACSTLKEWVKRYSTIKINGEELTLDKFKEITSKTI